MLTWILISCAPGLMFVLLPPFILSMIIRTVALNSQKTKIGDKEARRRASIIGILAFIVLVIIAIILLISIPRPSFAL